MPPTIVVPTEWRPSAPAPVAKYQRQNAENERERSHQNRPQAQFGCFNRGFAMVRPLSAQLLGELDNQNRVLRRKADEHHQTDLAVDIICKPAQ